LLVQAATLGRANCRPRSPTPGSTSSEAGHARRNRRIIIFIIIINNNNNVLISNLPGQPL